MSKSEPLAAVCHHSTSCHCTLAGPAFAAVSLYSTTCHWTVEMQPLQLQPLKPHAMQTSGCMHTRTVTAPAGAAAEPLYLLLGQCLAGQLYHAYSQAVWTE